jgi:hypothetical protein
MLRVLVVASLVGGGCADITTSDVTTMTLTVENGESVMVDALYIDQVGDDNFEDNLLGNQPLKMGATLVLDISCDHYDVAIENEGGDALCEQLDLELCFGAQDWVITDSFCPPPTD